MYIIIIHIVCKGYIFLFGVFLSMLTKQGQNMTHRAELVGVSLEDMKACRKSEIHL